MRFKIWLWWFEFRLKRVPDEKKLEYMAIRLFEYADKTEDLVVCTRTFKQFSLDSHNENELSISIGSELNTRKVKIKGGFKR